MEQAFFPVVTAGADFARHVRKLLGVRTPLMAWIDNRPRGFRFWNIAALYAKDGIVREAALFAVGGYKLILHAGTAICENADGHALSGGFSFYGGGRIFHGETLTLGRDGTFHFSIDIDAPNDIGLGIEYFAAGTDAVFGDPTPIRIRSPFVRLSKPFALDVSFFPFSTENTYFAPAEKQETETCFTTVYGEQVRLSFDVDFRFILQRRAGFCEAEQLYAAPAGDASGITGGMFMAGLSGTEYVHAEPPYAVRFHPNQRACWDPLPGIAPVTSYLSFDKGSYYCQPEDACYYSPKEGALMPHTQLIPFPVAGNPLPMMPYQDAENPSAATDIEARCIYPERRGRIEQALSRLNSFNAGDMEALTRHGLRVCVRSGEVLWMRLAITEEVSPNLALTHIVPRLMACLLADNLFLPINDAALLTALSGIPYSITQEHLQRAEKNGYTQTALLKLLEGAVYYSREEFDEAVSQAGAAPSDILSDACNHFGVTADGWRFLANPSLWEDFGTLLVLKFTDDACLADMIEEESLWSLQLSKERAEAARYAVRTACEQLAEAPNPELEEILYDPHWRGVVFFFCPVDVNSLPDELAFLAAGIDASLFKARFLAFPADTGRESADRVCAMIDYNDDVHLYADYYRDYAFKVLKLKVCIRNGKVYDFNAQVELLINALFGCPATGWDEVAGNNAVFDGSYQRGEDGVGHYFFVLSAPAVFTVGNSLIDTVRLESAALTADPRGCLFAFSGSVRLLYIGAFDLLSYDNLPFGGLEIRMTMAEGITAFAFFAERMSLISGGARRGHSFAEKFPASPVRLLRSHGKTPQDSGYGALWVQGIESAPLGGDWYGIVWEIQPGDLGNLSGADASMELLAAWEPDMERGLSAAGTPIYVGIRFGAAGNPNDWGLPLQGVMNLGFDAIELHSETDEGNIRYYFRFRNFALQILGMRFPDSNNDLYLFADESRRLGWYGAMGG